MKEFWQIALGLALFIIMFCAVWIGVLLRLICGEIGRANKLNQKKETKGTEEL